MELPILLWKNLYNGGQILFLYKFSKLKHITILVLQALMKIDEKGREN